MDRERPYRESLREIISHERHAAAARVIRGWPGYQPTPLHGLSGLARALGLGAIDYKDESERFGLGSFKALGGAYGVYRALAAAVREASGTQEITTNDLLGGRYRQIASRMTVTCATAGNHGRSVAWGSRLFGCGCVVFVPGDASPARAAAIASYGAEVRRTDESYDETVRIAEREAAERGWTFVSDAAYGGAPEIPRHVMQGYTVLVDEALSQLGETEAPTHVLVQAGVGGLAAAVCGHLWEAFGPERPVLIVVEPDSAACLMNSAGSSRTLRLAEGPATIMSGLACAEPSRPAWEILHRGADFFLAISDDASREAMRLLADAPHGDVPIVAGESGAAGLAGLLVIAADPARRRELGLDRDSRVLVIGTEGATDPISYREIVGREPESVLGG